MTCMQLGEHPAADQVVAEPLERIDLLVHRLVHGGQVVAGHINQQLAVVIFHQPQGVGQDGQVTLENAPVVDRLEVRGAVSEKGTDHAYRGHALLVVGQPGAALADGKLAGLPDPVVVDDVPEDVDRRGHHVRRDHDRGILIQAGRELQLAGIPEGTPDHLVPGRPVMHQRVIAGDVRAQHRRPERLAVHRRRQNARRAEPPDAAAGHVRTGLLE